MTGPSLPLDGIHVIDLTQLIAGPTATMALGQLGATVTKLERPSGDLARSIGGEPGVTAPPTFTAINGGKKSITLDLTSESGRSAALRVIGGADVVVQAFRPGVMNRLGLDYATLSSVNPGLIYVSLSAYNSEGLGGTWPGVDSVLQAATGVMSITGEPDGPPVKTGFQLIDGAASLAIGQATLAALYHRERTGQGSEVDLSLFEVSAYIQTTVFAQASHRGAEPVRPGNTAGALGAPTDMFATSDGYVMVAAYFPDQWIKLCTTLDAAHLIEDPRYATNADRIQNKEQLSKDLTPIFASRGRDQLAARLAEAGVISAPVLSQMEIIDDPKLRSLGRFSSVTDAEGKILWIPDLPYVASAWTNRRLGPPPTLGEHTEEVLRDAGFTKAEIQAMDDEGVYGTHVVAGW